MKKILYLVSVFGLLLSACQKEEDPLFDKTPTERIAEATSKYKASLMSKEYWIAYYDSHAILMKFKEDNTVDFISTYGNGTHDRTVSYRVDVTQVPELVFESHTIWHQIYEDNLAEAEYEFLFESIASDTIHFVSKTDVGDNKTELFFASSDVSAIEKVKAMQTKIYSLSSFLKIVDGNKADYSAGLMLNSDGTANTNASGSNQIIGYQATTSGLLVTPALTLTDGSSHSMFIFNNDLGVFQSAVDAKITIEESMTPTMPLTPYEFGVAAGNGRYNYIEQKKSSYHFLTFYNNFLNTTKENGLVVDRWYLFGLNTDTPYIEIRTDIGNIQYLISYEVKADGKVYITLSGATNATPEITTLLQPLLGKIANTGGHYIQHTGGLLNYSNRTFSLINADNPEFKINFYDFDL